METNGKYPLGVMFRWKEYCGYTGLSARIVISAHGLINICKDNHKGEWAVSSYVVAMEVRSVKS